MEEVETSDYIFKVIALGDASVGKTSLTLRFATDTFQADYRMTLGMNLSTKNVNIQDKTIQIAIWDTAGQSSFESLIPMYYRGALGAIVVYDITNRKSFEHMNKWVSDIRKFAEEIPIIIVGNKNDLEEDRVVSREEGEDLVIQLCEAWSKPIHFIETSAKESRHVNKSFQILAKTILNYVEEEEEDDEDDLVFHFESYELD